MTREEIMKTLLVLVLTALMPLINNSEVTFTSPLDEGFEISSNFGMRFHPILQYERMHNGVDWVVPEGTEVHAAAAGKVTFAGDKGTLGRVVIIDHGSGFETIYAHLKTQVEELESGDNVETGEKIALSGKSGLIDKPLLHFTITKDGEPVDPAEYLTTNR